MKRQQHVSKEAIKFIRSQCQTRLDNQKLTNTQAYRKKKGELIGIPISGRTLYKIFKGEHIKVNTIKDLIKHFGKDWDLENGNIVINEKYNVKAILSDQ
jgi:predicted transcriptional regulator